MALRDWLRDLVQAKVDEDAARLDDLLTEVVWRPPAETVVRSPLVPLGQAYELAGTLFEDGKTRLVVNTKQELREAPDDAPQD